MKRTICFLMPLVFAFTVLDAQHTYVLISPKTGKIDKSSIATLSPALKALAAFYAAMGGTDCMDQNCALTTALGLGAQGSDAQKTLIEKYFPGDKAAKLVLGQDCYLQPNTASSFSNFRALSFLVNAHTVQVNYILTVYDHGKSKDISGPDVYEFNSQSFKNKKRVLYAWTNKS